MAQLEFLDNKASSDSGSKKKKKMNSTTILMVGGGAVVLLLLLMQSRSQQQGGSIPVSYPQMMSGDIDTAAQLQNFASIMKGEQEANFNAFYKGISTELNQMKVDVGEQSQEYIRQYQEQMQKEISELDIAVKSQQQQNQQLQQQNVQLQQQNTDLQHSNTVAVTKNIATAVGVGVPAFVNNPVTSLVSTLSSLVVSKASK